MISGTSPLSSAATEPAPLCHQLLRRATCPREALAVCYRPRLDLAGGAVLGHEAVLTWPAESQAGQRLLAAACAQAASCDGRVSVALSGHLLRPALVRQIRDVLEWCGLDSEQLELALPEPALADAGAETLLILSGIRDLGVGLALDQFGTGWASLRMLKRLPLSALKLDGSLVRELPHSREDAALVRAIVQAGHALDLTIVADGVETEMQRAYLASIGCDQAQGPLFGLPFPSGDLPNAM
jgi:EAL domain-containing protein (putative c-di-GMP-specific phosphodiesterase class I)